MDYVLYLCFPTTGKHFLHLSPRQNGQLINPIPEGGTNVLLMEMGYESNARVIKNRVTYLLGDNEFADIQPTGPTLKAFLLEASERVIDLSATTVHFIE